MAAIVAEAVRRASDKLGDQGALAQALGTSRNTVSEWKLGKVERFDLEKLVALFDAADMSLGELQGREDSLDAGALSEIKEAIERLDAKLSGGMVMLPQVSLSRPDVNAAGPESPARVRKHPLPKSAGQTKSTRTRRKAE